MKKYGIYAHVKGSNIVPVLIRESDTLKAAAREAYRLARCNYRKVNFAYEFIVGNNTGVTLNQFVFNEAVRYIIDHGTIASFEKGE